MDTYIDSRIIILNGILLNGSYKSDINFNFTGLIKQEDNIQQIQISLVNTQIPYSFYTINYTNNNLTIIYQN